jgi:hypothetical protein
MALGTRVYLGIPTLKTARRSIKWIDAMAGLQMPLGSALGRIWIEDETIAAARNALCERALADDADYLVMLGDDVLPPANMLLSMLASVGKDLPVEHGQTARCSLLTGVYWTKSYPTEPYLWNGLLEGSYTDWKVGELFPVDLAGCDALIIETAILREIPRPWFSTDWTFEPGQRVSPIATEDFYFYTKARKHGFRLFCDTVIQCWHEDRDTGQLFGLTVAMPQAGGVPEGGDDDLIVATLGSGLDEPTWGEHCTVTRFDDRPDLKPDIRCDLSRIPEGYVGMYDTVQVSGVLERYGRRDAPDLVRHWARLLKPGGTLLLSVVNAGAAMLHILDDRATTADWAALYGAQATPYTVNRNGFTERKLKGLLGSVDVLADVEVTTDDTGRVLRAQAVLAHVDVPPAIGPIWDEIHDQEAAPETEPADPTYERPADPVLVPTAPTVFMTSGAVERLNGHEAAPAAVEAPHG